VVRGIIMMKSSIKRNQEDDEEADTDEHSIDIHHSDVPIAQRINKLSHKKQVVCIEELEESKKIMDIDEEIRQLEEDLAADDDTTTSDDDDDDDDGDSGDNDDQHHCGEGGVISLSKLVNDKIEPLPQNALPQNKRRKLKGVDSTTVDDHIFSSDKHKQRKRHNSTITSDKQSEQKQNQQQQHTVSEGLKSAVQDLLQNYISPSQIQRPAYYCRVCQHQSQTQIEFDNHRTSEFHTVAIKVEKKATYCKVCRKQLTSVIQMTEHLNSKPHRDRMDYVKGKHQRVGGRGGGVVDNGGRGTKTNGEGGDVRGKKSDCSTRQWC
jgi:hypothetical protein